MVRRWWELVIFDNDGVLVDSEVLANRVLADLLSACGYPATFEQCVDRFMGRTITGVRSAVEGETATGLPPDFEDRYHQDLFTSFRADLRPVAGVVAVLDELARSRVPFCVASSGTHERIRLALSTVGLLDRFSDDRIFSAEDVIHGKPAPDLFLLAASRVGVEPRRCLVVEDSPAGITAARAAGMTVVGYAAATPGERLADADIVATSMTEVLTAMESAWRSTRGEWSGPSGKGRTVPGVVEPIENGDDINNVDDTELRHWLRSQGATEDQLEAAGGGYELQRLAVDLVLSRGVDLSVRDVAAQRGIEPERIVEVLRAYGVTVSDIDAALFTEADAELFKVSQEAEIFESPDAQVLMRVVGNALDRVAEAAVALYVQGTEAELLRSGAPPLVWAQKSAQVTELAGKLGVGMGVLFRHHLRQAVDRQRVSQEGVTSPDVARVAVGFVDLVGSTAFGETLDVGEFRKLVTEFEAQAFEAASRSGGRVVKFIGDEIMSAALDPVAGCRMMLALVEACSIGELQPRGGLSWGEVLFRGGDYYGREVNLASRLVDAAIPGEVLVDVSVVEAVRRETRMAPTTDPAAAPDGMDDQTSAAGLRFERAGRRLLKGFADPVEVWSVTPADLP